MTKSKKLSIEVLGTSITVLSQNDEDFISLTGERVHNPGFNYGEFATIKSQAGLNSYRISVKDWGGKTNARGLQATAGRHGGTYAHKDIAFESPSPRCVL